MSCTEIINGGPGLSEAKIRCSENQYCTMIFDFECNGGTFHLCSGYAFKDQGSCVYIKENGRTTTYNLYNNII